MWSVPRSPVERQMGGTWPDCGGCVVVCGSVCARARVCMCVLCVLLCGHVAVCCVALWQLPWLCGCVAAWLHGSVALCVLHGSVSVRVCLCMCGKSGSRAGLQPLTCHTGGVARAGGRGPWQKALRSGRVWDPPVGLSVTGNKRLRSPPPLSPHDHDGRGAPAIRWQFHPQQASS